MINIYRVDNVGVHGRMGVGEPQQPRPGLAILEQVIQAGRRLEQ
jgi:hypothetical protein